MNKAILIIDMPEDCYDCPCYKSDDFKDWCAVTGESICDFKGREKSCPLIPAPNISCKKIGADIDTRQI